MYLLVIKRMSLFDEEKVSVNLVSCHCSPSVPTENIKEISRAYSRHQGHGCILGGAHLLGKRAFCLLAPPKLMSFSTISNENIFSKTQGTKLGAIIQKLPPVVFCAKRCFQKFHKIHRKTPVNFMKFLKTPFLKNTSGRLLLIIAPNKFLEQALSSFIKQVNSRFLKCFTSGNLSRNTNNFPDFNIFIRPNKSIES